MMRGCVYFDVIALRPIESTQIIKPGNMVRMSMGNQYSVNFCQLMWQKLVANIWSGIDENSCAIYLTSTAQR